MKGITLCFISLIISSSFTFPEVGLTGWIAVTDLRGICAYWNLESKNSVVRNFKTGSGPLVKPPTLNYQLCSWMETGKTFLAVESVHIEKEGTVTGHLVVLDTIANVKERIQLIISDY